MAFSDPTEMCFAFQNLRPLIKEVGDERRGKFGPWVEGVRKGSLGIATNFSLLRISHNRAFISKLYSPIGKRRVPHPSSWVGGLLSFCAPPGMPWKKEAPSNPQAPHLTLCSYIPNHVCLLTSKRATCVGNGYSLT
ncbi:hypothetical protein CDAR_32991 [Caerostris darwini]|uniref:Uncharacterized protein n=1 Tax=Caerostris darwini TaxID=1538125 RepID=A0AAV4SLV6_9ARAC|nr:hypothetical protein CDAR_32991 [Caerostris darwini]